MTSATQPCRWICAPRQGLLTARESQCESSWEQRQAGRTMVPEDSTTQVKAMWPSGSPPEASFPAISSGGIFTPTGA